MERIRKVDIHSVVLENSYTGRTLRQDYKERACQVLGPRGLDMVSVKFPSGNLQLQVDRVMERPIPKRNIGVALSFLITVDSAHKIVYESIGESCDLFEKDINIKTDSAFSVADRRELRHLWTALMDSVTED